MAAAYPRRRVELNSDSMRAANSVGFSVRASDANIPAHQPPAGLSPRRPGRVGAHVGNCGLKRVTRLGGVRSDCTDAADPVTCR